jgi:catechol 2,3-dioxygenase-like lactoylglutathione lyase family enzyme
MEVQALGYVGIGASDLTDWTDFATNWLGMQMVERGNACRAFRMDDRKQRLVVDRSLADGERYFGFEVADRAALDGLALAWKQPAWRCGASRRHWRISAACAS